MLPGFNSDQSYRGRIFHVQTEDSGQSRPQVITHLFLEGVVVTSAKSDYSARVEAPGLSGRVRQLMERQHEAMLQRLQRGDWDELIRTRCGPR
ncbi:MAG: hypothetical protein VCC04_07350 [Myxococcota bacterium]